MTRRKKQTDGAIRRQLFRHARVTATVGCVLAGSLLGSSADQTVVPFTVKQSQNRVATFTGTSGHGYLDTALSAISTGSVTAPEYLAASAFAECVASAIEPATNQPAGSETAQEPAPETARAGTPATNETKATKVPQLPATTPVVTNSETSSTTKPLSYMERLFPRAEAAFSKVATPIAQPNPRTGWSATAAPAQQTRHADSIAGNAAQARVQANVQGAAQSTSLGLATKLVSKPSPGTTTLLPTPTSPTSSASPTTTFPVAVSANDLTRLSAANPHSGGVTSNGITGEASGKPTEPSDAVTETGQVSTGVVRSTEIIVADDALLAVRILLSRDVIVVAAMSPLPYAGVLDALARPDVVDAVRTGITEHPIKLEGWDRARPATMSIGVAMRVPVALRAGLLDDALASALDCDLTSDRSMTGSSSQSSTSSRGDAQRNPAASGTSNQPATRGNGKPAKKKIVDVMDDPLVQQLLDWLAANPDS